ncbi:MAG: response regulator [Lachnospiraceae bacterium]|nr:response regulator [Lachnospiraceae bacterium]
MNVNTNESKNEFLAKISHELRTPLNAILGSSDLLLNEPLAGVNMEYALSIYASAQAMLQIINEYTEYDGSQHFADSEKPKFHAPDAKVLVIDDNEFNLRTAKGFLKLSKIVPDLAYCAKEGIALIKKNDYDIIFMDHMMPEMDGVEATALIREMGGKFADLKIIAITANIYRGAREFYLKNGFNDFIAKPINLSEFQIVLKSWLPNGKIISAELKTCETCASSENNHDNNHDNHDADNEEEAFVNDLAQITEIDTKIGLSRVEEEVFIYYTTVKIFHNNVFNECQKMTELLAEGKIDLFGTAIHAMKSILATIGAMELSEASLALELSAKKGEADFCLENYPPLQVKILSVYDRLTVILEHHQNLQASY